MGYICLVVAVFRRPDRASRRFTKNPTFLQAYLAGCTYYGSSNIHNCKICMEMIQPVYVTVETFKKRGSQSMHIDSPGIGKTTLSYQLEEP